MEERAESAKGERRSLRRPLIFGIALLGAPVVIWKLRPVLNEIFAAMHTRVSVHHAQHSLPGGTRSLTRRPIRSHSCSAGVRSADGRRVPVGSRYMWSPPDPDESSSELYRLIPPRPRSEIREALDAATGRARSVPGCSHETGPESGGVNPAERRGAWLGPFLSNTAANVVGGIIVIIVVALATYFFAHHSSRTIIRQVPASPSETASARPSP